MSPLVTFLTACLVLFFSVKHPGRTETLNPFSRIMAPTTCFRVRRCFLGIMTMDNVSWQNMSSNSPPPKMAVNRKFQNKTSKYKKSQYFQKYKSYRKSKSNLRNKVRPTTGLRGWFILSRSSHGVYPTEVMEQAPRSSCFPSLSPPSA